MRKWICSILSSLLAACGGGDEPIVEVYGDSLTFGSYGAQPQGGLLRLAVPPVRRLNELSAGRFAAVDLSLPGAIARDAWMGQDMMPFGPFEEHVRQSPASLIVLRYGGADAMRGSDVDEFATYLQAMISAALAAKKAVLLVGVIRVMQSDQVTAAQVAAADLFNARIERIAFDRGLPFVDVRAVRADLPADLADGVHPAQAWSDRITGRIADAVLALLA